MGMPGMNATDAAKYAAEAIKNDKTMAANSHQLTVAEFRNWVNPVTHYYDNYDAKSFLSDTSIPWKTKMLVVLGKIASEVIDEDAAKKMMERK